jgi:hypothetical protein
MLIEPNPAPASVFNIMVADGCVAAVPSLSTCECCLLINLTYVLTSLGYSRGLNSDASSALIVTTTHGLELGDSLNAYPRVSSEFPHQEMPPEFMASLPRYNHAFPVFQGALFRLDGMCPPSDYSKQNWLAENAVNVHFRHSFRSRAPYDGRKRAIETVSQRNSTMLSGEA